MEESRVCDGKHEQESGGDLKEGEKSGGLSGMSTPSSFVHGEALEQHRCSRPRAGHSITYVHQER